MANKRPKFQISIDPEYSDGKDLGWSRTAFTNRPAIMSKGIAFHAQDRPKEMFFADKLKYRIAAPMMIPMEIYRNEEGEEYDIEFTEKKIEQIHSKFMKNFDKNKALFNDEHDNTKIAPAYLLEILRIDTAAKQQMLLSDYNIKVPIGTLFGIAQITDKEYYNYLVENEKTGFSIEGFFGLALEDDELEEYEQHNFKKQTQMEKVKEQKLSDGGVSGYMQLPAGVHTIGGMIYTVEEVIENEGQDNEWKTTKIVSIVPADSASTTETTPVTAKEEKMSDATATEDKKEEEVAAADETDTKEEDTVKADEKKEEEVAAADEVVDETVTEETTSTNSETYSKEEVDAKFDEIYKMIAEIKGETAKEVIEEKTEEVAMSVNQRFAAFREFSKKI